MILTAAFIPVHLLVNAYLINQLHGSNSMHCWEGNSSSNNHSLRPKYVEVHIDSVIQVMVVLRACVKASGPLELLLG